MSTNILLWIILIPLIGAGFNMLFYFYHLKVKPVPELVFSLIGTVVPFISFYLVLQLFFGLVGGVESYHQYLYSWLHVGELTVSMEFLGDRLSIFMALFVTFVGWLIHIYAIGYMKGDQGYGKFFAYFNLFLASMLLLVLANNPIILFIGWEGVGVCSYLLISFYYKDAGNVLAGNKAFIVNRVGDIGFIMGIVTLFFAMGQIGLDYDMMQENIGKVSPHYLLISGILLFTGAMGKSAQMPLHVWLPDAMAGPTPISALIHAATMVTAGVYVVARFHFLYELIPNVGLFIAYIGTATAFVGAIIATKQTDIKKILAYSTMSQLGYMFIAVGLGLYSSGLFHVFTHAFFKAMLFMGAGGLILAVHHKQDIFEIAKDRVSAPVIRITFLIGVIAISGIPPFAGFFSKDAILAGAFESEHYVIWGIGLLTAFLTAFYMFRLYFILFVAPSHSNEPKHKTPWTIALPISILAIGAMFAGFLNLPAIFGEHHYIDAWLSDLDSVPSEMKHSMEYMLMAISVVVALMGAWFAYLKYAKFDLSKREDESGLIYNKFYIDELYDNLFIQGAKRLSLFLGNSVDEKLVDSSLMSLSKVFVDVGEKIRFLQNANVRYYVFYMLAGISVISIFVYLRVFGGLV